MRLLPVLALLLSACTAVPDNPPRNLPATAGYASARAPQQVGGEVTVALSFSGGGLRAAAFAHGVLEALREQPSLNGHRLLDDVAFITAVSGGSLTAAYFGLHGPDGLENFRAQALLGDGESRLRLSLLNPFNLGRLLGGGLNDRSHLHDWLEGQVFKGATYADLYRRGKPAVWINATNAQYRLAFPFHERAFDAICSDLSSFPISEAVAASMAVPVVFAPVVLRKYPENCLDRVPIGPGVAERVDKSDDMHRLRTTLLRALRDFRDPSTGPYLKLMDGGVTDNLGLVSILQSRVLMGTPYGPISAPDAERMRRMLFIVVDAGQGPTGQWGLTREGPSAVDLATAAIDVAVESTTRLSYAAFATMMRQWEKDIVAYRCALPPERQAALQREQPGWRCDDVQFRLTMLNFGDLGEAEAAQLNQIPTRLKLPAAQIDQLISAGRRALSGDAEVRRFVSTLAR